jgi:hypothetical protein
MARQHSVTWDAIFLFLLPVLVSCLARPSPHTMIPPLTSTVPSSIYVPVTLERLAILYPKTFDQDLMDAYARLEGVAFQFKEQRPSLRIVERFNLRTILDEQRFQLGGAVSDDSATRLGRLLGVDGILLYRIDGPTARDRLFARIYGYLAPLVVVSKIILVESGEIVFHNVVTSPVGRPDKFLSLFSHDPYVQVQIRAALDRAVDQTTADLLRAFQ